MILTTARLVLREVEDTDWQAILAYQSDPRYRHYDALPHHLRHDVQRLVREFVHWQHAKPRHKFQLAITLRTHQDLIGTCGIRQATAHTQEAELGYELHPDHWGQGYATEAARAILTFGFGTLHLQRIWAQCVAENEASVRVLERIGMGHERHRIKHTWVHNRGRDILRYAMSQAEWRAQIETVCHPPA
jgi:RimJ/RimL family protein N-acetyltransferase